MPRPAITDDTYQLPFGKKHQGKLLKDVPADFLLWCYDQPWLERKYPELAEYIAYFKITLEREADSRKR